MLVIYALVFTFTAIKAKPNSGLPANDTIDDETLLINLQDRVEALEKKLEDIGKVHDLEEVVLYVTLSTSMRDVSNHVTLIFDQPLMNPGDHYNKNDGIYIAHASGRILVYWTIATDETARTELMVEDKVVGTLVSAAGSVTVQNDRYSGRSTTVKESSSSAMAVVDIQKGDHVFLRTASDDNHILENLSSVLIRHLH